MFERGQREREALKAALRQWEFERSSSGSAERQGKAFGWRWPWGARN